MKNFYDKSEATIEFATIDDVETWYINSGFIDMEKPNGFIESEMIEYVWRNSSSYFEAERIYIDYMNLNFLGEWR